MSSTSSPPDGSNVVHGVFPTQGLRVGEPRRIAPERLPEEVTLPRSDAATGDTAADARSGEGQSTTPRPPEAQASFAFIAAAPEAPPSAHGEAPSVVAEALPRAPQRAAGADAHTSEAEARAIDLAADDLPEGTPEVAAPEASTPEAATGEGAPSEVLGAEIVAAAVAAHEEDADEAGASHEIASEEAFPGEEEPDEVASQEDASREVAPQEVIPDDEAPGQIASQVAPLSHAGIFGGVGLSEEASQERAVSPSAAPIAALRAPHSAAGREAPFPTLARMSTAREQVVAAAPTQVAPRPLTRAIDTAARLAADANAAAAALDSLKRLLQQGLPASGRSAIPRVAPAAEQRLRRGQAPLTPRPPPSATPERTTLTAPLATTHPMPLPPADRARFDVRGFFAGVALSCAIGIVLYLFMTAG